METTLKKQLLLCLFLLLAAPAAADELPVVVGQAGATDGDTIRMATATVTQNGERNQLRNVKIRLHGIDAPERKQLCFDSHDKPWACGQEATKYLASLIKSADVSCKVKDIDRYQRLVAICSTKSVPDLNADLVLSGLAVAYRKYSTDYVTAEESASAEHKGLWAGTFDFPWDWRKAH
jgi:endonuclease YncB( thermonuclease family)